MNDLYRDPLVHVHDRIADLGIQVADLRDKITTQFWDHHPADHARAEELAERVEKAALALAAGRVGDFEPGEAARARDAADASARIIALEHALSDSVQYLTVLVSRIPEFEATLAQIPPGRPPAQPFIPLVRGSFLGEDTLSFEGTLGKLTDAMRRIDPQSQIAAEGLLSGARIVVVRLASGRVPFTYTGALVTRMGEYPHLGSSIATFTARDVTPLQVRPDSILHGIGRALGLASTAKTGDAEFDATFLVNTAGAASRLSTLARNALLEIARCDVPTVIAEDGLARITWSYELTTPTFEGLVRAAIRCLSTLRSVSDESPTS